MNERFQLTPHEAVTLRHSSPQELEVEVEYAPRGERPPRHFHPHQDERFELFEGVLSVRVEGEDRELRPGDVLEVPRGTVHQMWNPGTSVTRARWITSPAGRTESWFRELGGLRAQGRVASNGMPGPLAFAVLLTEYRDVFRLAGPQPLLRGAFAAMAPLGRLRGYEPEHAHSPR